MSVGVRLFGGHDYDARSPRTPETNSMRTLTTRLAPIALATLLAAGAARAEDSAALAAAAKEAGAVVTPSGLVFRSIKDGTGAAPAATDTVRVNYRGTFPNGKVFDASSAPIQFPLNRVIPCWTEGVQKIKVGGKAKLTCPSAIAYGPRGTPGGEIPPNSTLVFEVELVGVAH
jgi:FKBP-type peptidyl-prolyl cis-trans isomerase FkpA